MKNNTSSAGLSSVLDDFVNITSVSEEKDNVLFPGELEKVTIALNDIATLVKSGVPPTEEQSRVKDIAALSVRRPECAYFTLIV